MFKNLVTKETAEVWGEFIRDLSDWDWFAMFSFKYPTSPRTANRLWRKEWLCSLEKAVNGQVHFVRVTQNEKLNFHYHCLLSGVGDQAPVTWENRWKHGIAQIQPYNENLGGAFYVGNACASDCEIAFSKNINKKGRIIN